MVIVETRPCRVGQMNRLGCCLVTTGHFFPWFALREKTRRSKSTFE